MSSGTCGLMGVFSFFMGMRMKLTKKIMAPLLVQECPGEVVGVAFHEAERFGGHGPAVGAPPAPPPNHPCWERGWVLLDRLPLYVEFRVDEATEDYTGLGRPGVWFLEPVTDDWTLHYKLRYTVNHPPRPARPKDQLLRRPHDAVPDPGRARARGHVPEHAGEDRPWARPPEGAAGPHDRFAEAGVPVAQ